MADNDSDEITIDFSAIKGWLKRKKAQGHPDENHRQDSSDDHKGHHSHQEHHDSHDRHGHEGESHHRPHQDPKGQDTKSEGIAISWPAVKKFIITWHLLLLLLIPMYIAYDTRVKTSDLPVTNQWARDTVYNNIRNQITSTIAKSYPNLPEAQRSEIVTEQFNKVIAEQKDPLEQQIKNQAAYFKSRFSDEKGHTMLLDIDSYSYLRETHNLLTFGHNGNTRVNGTDWDTYIMAPMGVPAGKNLHNSLGVWQFKIWKFFDKDIYLMKSFFYLPMIIYVLAIIPAFMIATYYGGGFAGVVSGIIIAIHPTVLTRTAAGVTDTDVYQIFFPLWVIWLYLEAFRRKTKAAKLTLGALSGVLLGAYSFSWSGWWLIFYLLIAITLLEMANKIYQSRQGSKINLTAAWPKIKENVQTLALFILFTGIFVTLLRDFTFFLGFVTEPFAFLALKKAANANLWPNVYTTVAELNPISIQGALSQISFGSTILLWSSIIGIILTLFVRDKDGHIDIKLFALLAMWFSLTMWASKSGVRFIGLAVPAFGLAVGAGFGIVAKEGPRLLKRWVSIPELASRIVLIVLLSLLLIAPVKSGYDAATRNIPLISDAWWQSLTNIRDNSKSNAIITSWWDFGHWFKAVADRPVTFDGGTQNTPIAHWAGKILLTNDEDQAVGILRMLDCGSMQGVKELEAQGFYTLDAINLLYSVFNLTRDQAREAYIQAGVKNPDSALLYSHCNPPEAFFITSSDMVGKSGVWAHFGSWNFKRSNIWVDRLNGTFEERVKDISGEHGYTPEEAERLQREVLAIKEEGEANSWIAPWPSFGGGTGCQRQGNLLGCQNGLVVNLTSMEIVFTGETAPIRSLVYIDGDDIAEKTYAKYNQDLDIALVPIGDQIQGVVMQHPLGRSMFTRLFYLEGHGLKHFKRFSDKTSVIGERIIVWKVDWAGNETNVYYHLPAVSKSTPQSSPSNSTMISPNSTSAPSKTQSPPSNNSSPARSKTEKRSRPLNTLPIVERPEETDQPATENQSTSENQTDQSSS